MAVSASGALSPGPLSAAAVVQGARGSWRSGVKMAAGHMTFELPFVVAIGLGVYELRWALDLPLVKDALGAVLGAFIAYFSIMTAADGVRSMRGALVIKGIGGRAATGPYITGLLLTAVNPFFLLWWLTVGLILVQSALGFGLVLGYSVMYASHVWMDYAWLSALSALGQQGRRLGGRGYGALLIAVAAAMLGLGAYAVAQLL